MRSKFGWVVVLTILGSPILPADEPSPTDDAVRAAIVRSLPFLEREGVKWMEERDCSSCHHGPVNLWAHRAAAAKGIAIDAGKLAQWEKWARDDARDRNNLYSLEKEKLESLDATAMPPAVREKLAAVVGAKFKTETEFVKKLGETLAADELDAAKSTLIAAAALPPYSWDRSGGGMDVNALLILAQYDGPQTEDERDFRRLMRELIHEKQLDDGSWTPGNQLLGLRRATRDCAEQTSSMWAAMALAIDEPRERGLSPQVAKTVAMTRARTPDPDNREWLATRMLFEKRVGDATLAEEHRQKLLAARNADGGWSWLPGNPSEPYTTSIALFTLLETGVDDHPRVVAEAKRFLLSTQRDDGGWTTPAKFISKTEDPERLKVRDMIYENWGTAWAAIALARSLPW